MRIAQLLNQPVLRHLIVTLVGLALLFLVSYVVMTVISTSAQVSVIEAQAEQPSAIGQWARDEAVRRQREGQAQRSNGRSMEQPQHEGE